MTKLKIMPLGGVGETGALNCMLYETEDTAILVDCGVGFAGDRYPGVNVIIPKFEDLEQYRHKLKALILTHGHEDHAGAVAFFRQRFDVPIYATPFTMGLVRQKLEGLQLTCGNLREFRAGDKFKIGDLDIESIFINHSIIDAVAFVIAKDECRALHLTDFKIDHSAPEGKVIDLARMKQLGTEGLDVLLMDSTNVFGRGWTTSENEVRTNLLEYFTKLQGRLIACLFSSNIHRIQSLIECARITGRKIAFTGRSTKEYTRIAKEIQRLDTKGVELYDVEDVTKFPDSEILVLATGSQAEPRSVLQRMSHNMFKPFRLREGDTLLMSSKMIPGNEGKILEMLNRLSLLGINIITEELKPPIHASGHAKQDELREIFRLTKPKFFIPIHGEYRHLRKHAEIAMSEGLTKEQVVIITNGDKVEISEAGVKQVEAHIINRVFMTDFDQEMCPTAVTRRRKIAFNGLVGVSVLYDRVRQIPVSEVTLNTSAMFGGEVQAQSDDDLRRRVNHALEDMDRIDPEKLEQKIKGEVRAFYKSKFDVRPEVMVLISEI